MSDEKIPRLWIVTVETEVVVIARDEAEAQSIGLDAARDEESDCTAREMTYLPSGWTGDALPHGTIDDDDPEVTDRTIDEWTDHGAAPGYASLRLMKRAREAKASLKGSEAPR